MDSKEDDPNITDQGQVPSFLVLYFAWTPLIAILQFEDHPPARTILLMHTERYKHPQK